MLAVDGGAGFSRASVLAVDDTPSNLLALQALIGSLGHEVVCAASGREALELAAQHEFAVILLDVMMPGMNGFDTLESLRKLPVARQPPVIFLTAQTLDAGDLQRAYALGAVDYVAKPVSPQILRSKVDAFVALSQRDAEIRRQAAALRAKDCHIGVLAHDVRNPLAVIVVAAARLSEHQDERVRTNAARVARAAQKIQNLADDLLEFARMASGTVIIKKAPVDAATVCRQLLDDFDSTHPGVTVVRSLPETLAGSWDAARLEQAVSNLLTNAIKHGKGRISLSAEKTSTGMRITVQNGCSALSPAQLERFFEPFAQGNDRRGGVGLGLFIVREIARAHGGDARASWQDGQVSFVLEFEA